MAITRDLISRASARSLEEFSDQFRSALALGEVEQWSTALGLSNGSSDAIKTTYPIPLSAAGYEEFKGDMKYRSLYMRTMSVVPRLWQDGVAELAQIVDAPDFTGFADEPSVMAFEAQRLPNTLVAEQLEANPVLAFYTDDETNTPGTRNMFELAGGDPHPYNVFDESLGNFANDFDTPTTIGKDLFASAKQQFRSIKGANGKPLGLRMTHFMVPAAREEEAKEFLEQDMLIEAVTNVAGSENVAAGMQRNRHKGTVQLIVSDELTDDNDVYCFAMNKPGMYPWVVQTSSPEEFIHDKSSALYELEHKVGVRFMVRAAANLALPHCVQRYTLA